jgi:hypothetical protein
VGPVEHSPQCGSHPPKISPRQQPYRIAAALALLPLLPEPRTSAEFPTWPSASPPRRCDEVVSYPRRCRNSTSSISVDRAEQPGPSPTPVAECRISAVAAEKPTSRLCSVDESVVGHHRFRRRPTRSFHGLVSPPRFDSLRCSPFARPARKLVEPSPRAEPVALGGLRTEARWLPDSGEPGSGPQHPADRARKRCHW